MVAIFSDDKKEFIIKAVKDMYTDVALNPDKGFHFPSGRPACLFVGYPEAELDAIPETAVESFAGVGYPHRQNTIQTGDVVLDIGSGSGTDVLISALRTGSDGHVHGLDMTPAMLEKLGANIKAAGISHASPLEGNAEEIPLPDASVDVATSNGVLNLVPDKAKAFAEIFRVLKPGGRMQLADIVINEDISEKSRNNPQLWAECIVGAAIEDIYVQLFRDAGFQDVTLTHDLDYFSASDNQATRNVAGKFKARTIELTMQKPA